MEVLRQRGTACVGGTATFQWCASARDSFGMVCIGEGQLDDMRRRDGFFAMVCIGEGQLWDDVRRRGTA